MVKQDVYKAVKNLKEQSKQLRSTAIDEKTSFDEAARLRKQQNVLYNKFKFYTEFIKACDKVKVS